MSEHSEHSERRPPGEDAGTIRVLVSDDQRVTREGLVLLIGLNDGMEVVASAADGAEAVRLVREHHPDVVLMDLHMPGTDGITATAILHEEFPEVAVLVLTTYLDDASVFPALRAGAKGYLTKDAGADQIERAVHAVNEGRMWMDPAVQERLVAAVTSGETSPPAPSPPTSLDGMTPREAEVLTLIAQGLSNAEICSSLFLSQATVKSHINRIFAKIGARDRAQAVRYAYRHGLVRENGGA